MPARTASPSPSAVNVTTDPSPTSKLIQAQHSRSRSMSSLSATTAPGAALRRIPPGTRSRSTRPLPISFFRSEVDPSTALTLQVDELAQRNHGARSSTEADPARHQVALHQAAAHQLP